MPVVKRNAGDRGLIPEPSGIWIPPPPELGSGKFGTPCERMQSAALIPAPAALEPDALCEVLDDPQAAIATEYVIAAHTLKRRWRSLLRGSVVDDGFIVKASA